MKLHKFQALAVAAGAVLALSSGAARALETTFNGYTNGCFAVSPAPSCTPVSDTSGTQTATLSGLTYLMSNFSGATAGGVFGIGAAGVAPPGPNIDNLGSFTLDGTPFVYNGQHFDVMVTFVDPTGILPSNHPIFSDTLFGTVASLGNGGVFIDFDNTPQAFTFDGGGSFTFSVNDLTVQPGHTVGLTGTIIASAVPEPETYALLMAGLAAVGFMARRRKA